MTQSTTWQNTASGAVQQLLLHCPASPNACVEQTPSALNTAKIILDFFDILGAFKFDWNSFASNMLTQWETSSLIYDNAGSSDSKSVNGNDTTEDTYHDAARAGNDDTSRSRNASMASNDEGTSCSCPEIIIIPQRFVVYLLPKRLFLSLTDQKGMSPSV